MAVLDKVGAFLSQLGAEAAPIAKQIGTNVLGLGQNINPMFNKINTAAQTLGANVARPGATAMGQISNQLANLNYINPAVQMQSSGASLNNLNPQQLAMLGYGVAGLGGGVTAGTAAAILANKKKRKAGQYLAAQNGLTMDENVPVLY